jgi:AraC-like DNA-binding protein
MQDIFASAQGKNDIPHRHDYYTVLLVEKANGRHFIDYQTYPFRSREVHFVSPGQVHQVALKTEPQGWVLTFSRDFLFENNIPENFISNINLFHPFGESPPLLLDKKTFNRLLDLVLEIKNCLILNLTYRNRALGALLQLFLIFANNSSRINAAQLNEDHKETCVLRDFKKLVDQRFTEWHKVTDYASEINLSSKHLSQSLKNITGKGAKEFIQDRIVLEAKRLLLHTDLSISEVGYKLGFEEPLHFSGFFKKKIGISPSKFRAE